MVRVVPALILGVCSGCGLLDPFNTQFEDVSPAVMYRARQLTPAASDPDSVVLMTWNIKFAGGRIRFFFECNGTRSLMKAWEVRDHLEKIAEKIWQAQPDVLLLQEADTESKRGAYIDHVQWLLDATYFNYGAYASQWKSDFVPSDGIGRINSGNVILSRWPLRDATRYALPTIDEQDAVTRYFYLRRNYVTARVDFGTREVTVLNTHTAAFAEDDTQLQQLRIIKEAMDGLEGVWAAGGDFNAVPPGSAQLSNFPDSCDDSRFEGDDYTDSADWMQPYYDSFTPAISLVDYQNNQGAMGPYFTFTGDEDVFWNRKLDYLFTNGVFLSPGLVHQNEARGGLATLGRSDHAPLSVQLQVLP